MQSFVPLKLPLIAVAFVIVDAADVDIISSFLFSDAFGFFYFC